MVQSCHHISSGILTHIHSYIISHYNTLVRTTTTYAVYVYFIHQWRDVQFKVNFEWQIFEKVFMAILFAFRFFAQSLKAEKKSPKEIVFR